jgi:hypothetical protein
VFDAAPDDSGFVSPSVWTAVGVGASVNVAATGNIDPGQGEITKDGMCAFSGFTQTFEMPPLDRAEPFKLSVTYSGVSPQFDLFNAQFSIGVGGEFFDAVPPTNAYRTDTFCLGPRAYGGPVEFRVGTFGGPNCTGTSTSVLAVDKLQVLPAGPGECPPPQTVVNGDFEGAAPAWTFNAVQGATAAIVAGVGEGGTKGAQLTTANRCSEASMTGTIAFPSQTAMPNQAIDVFWSGTFGGRLTMSLDGKNMGELVSQSTTGTHTRVCVPAWATGTTTSLGLFLQRNADNACTTALAKSFAIDNISIVSEATCNNPTDITDPGFERVANLNGPASGWGLLNGYVNDQEGSTATIVNASSLAHTGNGVLELVGANECVIVGDGGADLPLIVPAPQGAAGPALKFFAKVGAANAKTDTRVGLMPLSTISPNQLLLPENGTYTQSTLCLPAALARRRVTVRFSTGDSDGGGCGPNYGSEFAFVDDVELTTDSTCPAQ